MIGSFGTFAEEQQEFGLAVSERVALNMLAVEIEIKRKLAAEMFPLGERLYGVPFGNRPQGQWRQQYKRAFSYSLSFAYSLKWL